MDFANFLIELCWNNYGQFYADRKDFENHYESGEVKIPMKEVEKSYELFLNTGAKQFPSQFKNGDKVILNFFNSGVVANCTITKVSFNSNQVFYDVEIKLLGVEGVLGNSYTRLHNINSRYVLSANDTQSQTLVKENLQIVLE